MSRRKHSKSVAELRAIHRLSEEKWKIIEQNRDEVIFLSQRGKRRTVSRH